MIGSVAVYPGRPKEFWKEHQKLVLRKVLDFFKTCHLFAVAKQGAHGTHNTHIIVFTLSEGCVWVLQLITIHYK